jgi:hypothetical protein
MFAIFIIGNLHNIYNIMCSYVYYLRHTKFYVLNVKGSLIITIKPKAKEKFRAAAMLFTSYKETILKTLCIFARFITIHHIDTLH